MGAAVLAGCAGMRIAEMRHSRQSPFFAADQMCGAAGAPPASLALTDQKKASADMPRPFKQFQVQSYSTVCVLQQLQ